MEKETNIFNVTERRLTIDNLTWNSNSSHHFTNFNEIASMTQDNRDSLLLVIPITFIYGVIFIVGFVGNISTCIVISKNKSMYSATNYYLYR